MIQETTSNEHYNKNLIHGLHAKLAKAYLGGGDKKLNQQRELGKLTARERIATLLDQDSFFLEIGALVGDGMYEEYGGCPSGGVITGIDRKSVV